MAFEGVAYVCFGFICLLTLYLAYKVIKDYNAKLFFGNFFFGAIYALALMLGGIARPSKMLGFFSMSKDWDPTVGIFLLCTLGFLRIVYLFFGRNPPEIDSAFDMPLHSAIDKNLIIGSIIFGLGWGLSGLSIGPALINLLVMDKAIIYVVSIVLGASLQKLIFK